ncbi:unnamed protein product [Fraxinus pennsylvanica]|uniref:Uncharacterized protein n=1 Tax=Fraxinus pennsylvanica TaxID=56036 RepID=A0AAD1YX11_9LAMI|nr:unnamed protein product [Fraxinus pennsylvanica]
MPERNVVSCEDFVAVYITIKKIVKLLLFLLRSSNASKYASLDLSRIDRIIRCSLSSQGLLAAAVEPVPESNVSSVEERSMEDRERWWKMGLKAISDGKLGVLLLSGGQVLMER